MSRKKRTRSSKIRSFKDVYKLPLKNTWGTVFSINNTWAFTFEDDHLTDHITNNIVSFLNGETDEITDEIDFSTISYDESYIYLKGEVFSIYKRLG